MKRSFLWCILLHSVGIINGDHRQSQHGMTGDIKVKVKDVCPRVRCGGGGFIPKECRKPRFTVGFDGQTRCKMCDESFCGDPEDVCPPTEQLCPQEHSIPVKCRIKQFEIGSDGITMCKVCSKNACVGPIDVINYVS